MLLPLVAGNLLLGPAMLPSAQGQLQAVPGPQVPPQVPKSLQPLLNTLKELGFQLRLAAPPAKGAYGQFEPRTKTLWVHPLAFELGIGVQTLLHEAVHAAQSCPHGTLTTIGWRLPLETTVRQEIEGITYLRYHNANKAIEREAFAMQGQSKAQERIITALKQRCTRGANR
ncbi:MAG: hypothetical protein VKM98_07855 [Cyanobacteriota bacterium]|nr:hypothetical protein [Cyanobacteriota bacterium]